MSFENKIIFLSAITLFISLVDVNIVMVSYPVLAQVFNVNISGVVLVGISFLMTLAIGLPIAGRINDLIGVKKTLIIGYLILIVTGILCAISDSLNQLAFFRAMQGFGAALLSIAATSILIIYIPPQRRGRAFGIGATSGAVGLSIGAPIGGILTGYIGWQSIFIFTIPLSLWIVWYCYRVIPASQESLSLKKFIKDFDFIGSLLISLAIGLFVYIMDVFIHTKEYSLSNIAILIISLITILIFAKYEMNTKMPLIDISILKNRYFSLIIIANVFAIIVLSINNFIMPFYLMQHLSLSPQYTGFTMIYFSLMLGILSPFIGKLSEKVNPYMLCLIGMIISLISTLIFISNLETTTVTYAVIFLITQGVAFAFFISPVHSAALSLASKENAGSTTAIFRMTRQIASLLGVVLVGLLVGSDSLHVEIQNYQHIFTTELIMTIISILFLITILTLNGKTKNEF